MIKCSLVIDQVVMLLCVCWIMSVVQGFLWARHLQVVLVLQQVQRYRAGRPLLFLPALLVGPVDSRTHEPSIILYRCSCLLAVNVPPLTFFPGSPPIPGGPASPGSPCGAKQNFQQLSGQSQVNVVFISFDQAHHAEILLQITMHLLSKRSRITQTTRRTLRTLKNTHRRNSQKKFWFHQKSKGLLCFLIGYQTKSPNYTVNKLHALKTTGLQPHWTFHVKKRTCSSEWIRSSGL